MYFFLIKLKNVTGIEWEAWNAFWTMEKKTLLAVDGFQQCAQTNQVRYLRQVEDILYYPNVKVATIHMANIRTAWLLVIVSSAPSPLFHFGLSQ